MNIIFSEVHLTAQRILCVTGRVVKANENLVQLYKLPKHSENRQ